MTSGHSSMSTVPPDACKSAKWPGFYPGRVVNNNDPEKSGRLQIRYEQVCGDPTQDDGEIQDDQLPWAFPCFPVTGVQTGEYHVPPVGSQVWVSWFGGSPEYPIWFGGTTPTAQLPPEFASSYEGTAGPKTRLVKNEGLQVFEMRWKKGEEEIHLDLPNGMKLRMIQSTALGGPKIVAETPLGYRLTLDEQLKVAKLETPGQRVVELNETVPLSEFISVRTPTQSVTILDTPPGAITVTTLGTLTLTGAVAVALQTSGILALLTVSPGLVQLGLAGVFRKLVDARFFTFFDAHVHGGPGTPPTVLSTPSAATLATTNTEAN